MEISHFEYFGSSSVFKAEVANWRPLPLLSWLLALSPPLRGE